MTHATKLNYIQEKLIRCKPKTLDRIMKIVDKEYQELIEHYNDKDRFMCHNEIDDYFYVVTFKNGRTNTYCYGDRAYEEYESRDDIIEIGREEKGLYFPYEMLARKRA